MQVIQAGRPVDRSKDNAILQAARHLLSTSGIGSLSMEAVAKAAGVSKATLYNRFANRQQLIEALLSSQTEFFSETLQQVGATVGESQQALIESSVRLLEFLLSDEQQCLMNVMQSGAEIPAELCAMMYQHGPQATFDNFVGWLDKVDAAGQLQLGDSHFAGECLFGMLVGMDWIRGVFRAPVQRQPALIRSHVERVIALFWQLFAVKP